MNTNSSKFRIENVNPLWNIILLIAITIISTFDFKPFLSTTLIIVSFFVTAFLTDFKLKDMIKTILPFTIIAVGFILIISLTRYLSNEDMNLENVLSIGIRIILMGCYSIIFVRTTNPTELVICLIKYFKFPEKWGYGFLSAYRFLPNFRSELEIIKYAHQVRGISLGNNVFTKLWNSKVYIIPLMSSAVRKGIRVSMAMETKGFGKYDTRTRYRDLKIEKGDIIFFIISILFLAALVYLYTRYDLTQFSLIYKDV